MKFTCLRDNLSKGLSIVSRAIPIKSTLPILANVLIVAKNGRIRLAGTDLYTTIVTSIGASVDEEGAITVPAKLLSEFISHLSAESVESRLKNDILHLSTSNTKSKFNGVNAVDFPDLPGIKKDSLSIELDAKEFSLALSQVGFAVALDDTRPVFSGILLSYKEGVLHVVACDGYRLCEKKLELPTDSNDFSVVLPARTMLEVARIFGSEEKDIKLYVNEEDNVCLFEGEDTLVATRIINGEYPDYTRIIPTETILSAEFLAEELLEAVKLTNVFAKGSDNILKMTLDPEGVVRVKSSSQEMGENFTEFGAAIDGDLLEVNFNARYLLDFLNNNKFEKLVFCAKDNTSPCLIKPTDVEDFLHVVAPLHINE